MASIQMTLLDYFQECDSFTVQQATEMVQSVKDVNRESIRARIYEAVDIGLFEKLSRGVYRVKKNDVECLLVNGNGRDLTAIKDSSIDGIITDHPYDLSKQLKGGNRDFATYELFKYEQRDFDEKYRVLKNGSFLVEFIPEENSTNYDYLYEIKCMAKKAGFKYYAKVPWKKGTFKANTGRKSSCCEDIIFFTKGEPRCLKLDTKKNIASAASIDLNVKGKSSYEIRDILIQNNIDIAYMKGSAGMLPTEFDFQPAGRKEKIMEAEKPVALIEEIIKYISKPYEIILDQYSGSGNIILACINQHRNCIAVEKNEDIYNKSKSNIASKVENDTDN